MKIIRTYGHNRRDFYADFRCELCKYIERDVSCYDDSYFHDNVIPNMICKECGSKSLEITSSARYDDSVIM